MRTIVPEKKNHFFQALQGNGVFLAWHLIKTGKFKDPEVRELAANVKLENDPEAEEMELREGKVKCTVTVKFKDGTVKKATIYHVKGAPGNPMTEDELKAKFRTNTIDIFSEDQVARIIDTVLNLEKLPKVSDLTKLLSSPEITLKKVNKKKTKDKR